VTKTEHGDQDDAQKDTDMGVWTAAAMLVFAPWPRGQA
jgi:hypothetical protein